ncbi:hypothetical protein SH467x_003710 [Pirellulaceae bacterium SH467]
MKLNSEKLLDRMTQISVTVQITRQGVPPNVQEPTHFTEVPTNKGNEGAETPVSLADAVWDC